MEVTRRDFLRAASHAGILAGSLGAGELLLAACGGPATGATGGPLATAPPTVPPPPPSRSDAGPPDWAALSRSLDGTLLLPGSPAYEAARPLANPRFDAVRPQAIALCASAADVQRCLAAVRGHGVVPTARSGGHSYAGYSTSEGLVVDVGRISAVAVDRTSGIASVGAGAQLIDVDAALATAGMALPAGTCPSVGVAGLTLGGGFGVASRAWGLTADHLVSADVVTADSRLLTCDATTEPDLYWALRGGGGGNLGIATAFRFATRPVTAFAVVTLGWPWAAVRDVVSGWQRWAPAAPDDAFSNCILSAAAGGPPGIGVDIVSIGGGPGALDAHVAALTAAVGSVPRSRSEGTRGWLAGMLLEAGCDGGTVSACHLAGRSTSGTQVRQPARARSDFAVVPLPPAGVAALATAVAERARDARPGAGAIALDAYGGAIARVAAGATAFVHRDALFSLQYVGGWAPADGPAGDAAAAAWLAAAWTAMRPHVSGQAYQNYMDPDLAGWPTAYYGANLPRLLAARSRYDPDRLFTFPQGLASLS